MVRKQSTTATLTSVTLQVKPLESLPSKSTLWRLYTFAGWDYGRGDKLRKASAEELEAMRSEFIEDALNKYDFNPDNTEFVKQMDELWSRIVRYMGYGFNKSHGVAYSMISYMTAWLEHHFPTHFQAALMSTKMSDLDKIAQVFQDVRREGFDFQAPDINKSGLTFMATSTKIVFPLLVIKGVGDGAVKGILEAREAGRFTSLENFMERIDRRVVNARPMRPLILAGAFDEIEPDLTRMEVLVKYYKLKGDSKKKIAEVEAEEWNENIMAEYEKTLLGVYITAHPLEKYHFKNWQDFAEGYKKTLIGGCVTSIKTINDRSGRRMAFVGIDTLQGLREVTVFANQFKSMNT
ncbi:DNA polymerase [Staphylococcus phage MVC_VPHSA1]|uniref:DNA polymerase n=1 Tax=Staphylococcus phage MVC_VPHSA1 TaxID=3088876 RepID=A0ABZ0QYU3_9CAUD|nr:DNA polymerase [Staphylococcus phage MVC_VPHSA1]